MENVKKMIPTIKRRGLKCNKLYSLSGQDLEVSWQGGWKHALCFLLTPAV